MRVYSHGLTRPVFMHPQGSEIGNEVVDFFKTIIDENCAKPGV